jgi:hypothetical protein
MLGITFPKISWEVCQYYIKFIIHEETASECLPYARTETQLSTDSCIPEFQRLAFEKCVSLENTDFQMSPPDID